MKNTIHGLALLALLIPPLAGCTKENIQVKDSISRGAEIRKTAYLGILYAETPSGIRIVEVYRESPAERAGLKIGDLVVSLNGRPVEGRHTMASFIRSMKPGDEIRIEVVRNSDIPLILKARLDEIPSRLENSVKEP